MARLLIAGYGFLGESLRHQFSVRDWEVDAISRSGGNGIQPRDLSEPASVAAIEGEYDLIISCAATRGGGVEAYRAVYFEGCRNLISRFPDTPFIFTSSTSVYGQVDHSEVTELSPFAPTAETSLVLRETEEFVLGSGGVVLRLSALCSPGRCHTLKSFLNGSARLDGKGERILNFVHRDDVAAACGLISQNWSETRGRIFNISAASLTQFECYQLLAEHYARPLPTTEEVGVRSNRRGNTSKIVVSEKIKALGWEPQYPDFLSIALASG